MAFLFFRRVCTDARHLIDDLEISPSSVCVIPKKYFVVMAACSWNSCSLEVLVDVRREEEVQRSVALA